MKKTSTIFLQIVVVVLGIAALAFMLWEPHTEGRNVGATLFEIYFKDSFLVCAYLASIPFFVAFWQAYKLLGYIGRNEVFSKHSVRALRIIKQCATSLVGVFLAAEAYLFIVRPEEDIAGGVFMGLLMIFVFGVSASVARMFEQIVQNAVDTNKGV